MNRRVAIVLVCTLLALVAATVWVPVAHYSFSAHMTRGDPPVEKRFNQEGPSGAFDEYDWVWRRAPSSGPRLVQFRMGSSDYYHSVVVWRLVVVEQALILLLGGGLLTWVVRREKRKKAGAEA